MAFLSASIRKQGRLSTQNVKDVTLIVGVKFEHEVNASVSDG